MKSRLLSILLLLFLITGLVGCGKESYSENMLKVRKFSPWYLSSKIKAGEIYDKVLRNTNWEEKDNQVIISGIDKITNKKIVVIYKVKEYSVDVEKMTVDDEEKDYFYWYKYMTNYIME